MAYKIEVIGSSLVVTDLTANRIIIENPKRDTFFESNTLIDYKKIQLYNTTDLTSKGYFLWDYIPLSQAQNAEGVTFTDATFRDFARLNLATDDISSEVQNQLDSMMKEGEMIFVLDGVQTVFDIPHGLGSAPNSFSVSFSDAGNLNFVQSLRTKDATKIRFTCNDAPTAGTQIVYWQVYK